MESCDVENVYNFFRNILNILPTREQKRYIKFIHEKDRSTYYKSYRQNGETVAINGYILWLLETARISQEKITIVMAGKHMRRIFAKMDCLNEIMAYSKLNLKYKRTSNSIIFEDGSRVIYVNEQRSLRGYDIDYLYLNGVREGFETLRVNRKIIRTIEP